MFRGSHFGRVARLFVLGAVLVGLVGSVGAQPAQAADPASEVRTCIANSEAGAFDIESCTVAPVSPCSAGAGGACTTTQFALAPNVPQPCPAGVGAGSTCVTLPFSSNVALEACPSGTAGAGGACLDLRVLALPQPCPAGSVGAGTMCVSLSLPADTQKPTLCPAGQIGANSTCVALAIPPVATPAPCPSGSVGAGTKCVTLVIPPISAPAPCPSGTVGAGSRCITIPLATSTEPCPSGQVGIGSTCTTLVLPAKPDLDPAGQVQQLANQFTLTLPSAPPACPERSVGAGQTCVQLVMLSVPPPCPDAQAGAGPYCFSITLPKPPESCGTDCIALTLPAAPEVCEPPYLGLEPDCERPVVIVQPEPCDTGIGVQPYCVGVILDNPPELCEDADNTTGVEYDGRCYAMSLEDIGDIQPPASCPPGSVGGAGVCYRPCPAGSVGDGYTCVKLLPLPIHFSREWVDPFPGQPGFETAVEDPGGDPDGAGDAPEGDYPPEEDSGADIPDPPLQSLDVTVSTTLDGGQQNDEASKGPLTAYGVSAWQQANIVCMRDSSPCRDDASLLAKLSANGLGFYRTKIDELGYDQAAIDRLVRHAANNYVELLPVLIRGSAAGSGAEGLYVKEPDKPNPRVVFAKFAEGVARRYGPISYGAVECARKPCDPQVTVCTPANPCGTFWIENAGQVPYRPIRVWEVWNEPNSPIYWRSPYPPYLPKARAEKPASGPRKINAAPYSWLLYHVDNAIRRVNPKARILVGGLIAQRHPPLSQDAKRATGVEFLTKILEHRKGRCSFDAVSIHPYAPRPPDVRKWTALIRHALTANGAPEAQIWPTEFGWATGGGHPKYTVRDEAEQASYLERAIVGRKGEPGLRSVRHQYGIGPMFWWSYTDDPVNMINWQHFTGLLAPPPSNQPGALAREKLAFRKLRDIAATAQDGLPMPVQRDRCVPRS